MTSIRIEFTIDAPLYGYRSSRDRLHDPAYKGFKERVLAIAMAAGWKARARSTKEWPARLSVFVRWKKNPRVDWKNVYGAIEDAIFEQDRYVIPGRYSGVSWDAGAELCEVVIEC